MAGELVNRQAELNTVVTSLRTAITNCDTDIAALNAADLAKIQSYPQHSGTGATWYDLPASWQPDPQIVEIRKLRALYQHAITALGRPV
jgi:hypothetical protein